MRGLPWIVVRAALVALGLCSLSVLQAHGIVALVERGLGPPPLPVTPPFAVPSTPPPKARTMEPACVARAFESGRTPPTPAPSPAPRSLLGDARISRTADGLALRGVLPGSLFGAIGLSEGDVITHVNGQHVRRPEAGLLALGLLRRGGDVVLRVQRQGRAVTLTYHVR